MSIITEDTTIHSNSKIATADVSEKALRPTDPDGISRLRDEFARDEKDLTWKLLETEHLIRDKWIDFRRLKYEFPDGSVFEPYYNYSRRDYVVIVASDENGNYLCVRQFRQGIEEVTTEFPAGGIERGENAEYREEHDTAGLTVTDSGKSADPAGIYAADTSRDAAGFAGHADESALAAAKRELQEETGYISDEWSHLLTIPSAATITDNYAFIFRARNCRRVSSLHLDETEFLRRVTLSPDEIEYLIVKGKFQQAVHVMAWLLALREDQK